MVRILHLPPLPGLFASLLEDAVSATPRMRRLICDVVSATQFPRRSRYCFGMFALLITFAQRSISARMKRSNSSRVVGEGGITNSVRRAASSGVRRTAVISAFSLSRIGTGTAAGAHTPYHELTS